MWRIYSECERLSSANEGERQRRDEDEEEEESDERVEISTCFITAEVQTIKISKENWFITLLWLIAEYKEYSPETDRFYL